jgi:hypothetical protein
MVLIRARHGASVGTIAVDVTGEVWGLAAVLDCGTCATSRLGGGVKVQLAEVAGPVLVP